MLDLMEFTFFHFSAISCSLGWNQFLYTFSNGVRNVSTSLKREIRSTFAIYIMRMSFSFDIDMLSSSTQNPKPPTHLFSPFTPFSLWMTINICWTATKLTHKIDDFHFVSLPSRYFQIHHRRTWMRNVDTFTHAMLFHLSPPPILIISLRWIL